MRSDLIHLFDEQPKQKPKCGFPRSSKANSKNRIEEADDSPKQEGMGDIYLSNKDRFFYKEGGYHNFRPVDRILKSKVGQPWNEVFSEICNNTDNRRYDGRQLRWWVENILVDTHCQMIDGEVYTDRGMSVGHLYVHPETGILETASKKPRQRRKTQPPTVFEMDGKLYHQHDGIWWRVKFRKWKKIGNNYGCYNQLMNDVFLGRNDGYYTKSTINSDIYKLREKYGKDADGDFRLCIWKQSANKKEIAQLKKLLEAA